ncbi:hypothetical protein [Trinickia sp.]|uniref:hypothetical protein n=1 Tax=Trinickia sp. TaxID=2571163 RepID=UPI003F7F3963
MAELTPLASPVLPGDIPEWQPHLAVVSWSAVFAGAVAAAAFGLILLTLGAGLGLAALSPWRSASASAAKFGIAAIVWVCVTQILTSGLGGYLAGRLRHRWPAVHVDEVYFRDTAHGFLSWALATLATAALFAAMLPAAEHAGGQAVAKAAASAVIDRGDANAAMNRWPVGYYVDALFRPPASVSATTASSSSTAATSSASAAAAPAISAPASSAAPSAASNASAPVAAAPSATAGGSNAAAGTIVTPVATPALTASAASEPPVATGEPVPSGEPPKREVARIFLNSLATNDALSAADIAYVARIVSRYTGMAPPAAEVRVAATYAQLQQKMVAIEGAAKDAANNARRASVFAALWLFVSLLMGAFSACFMAVFGGRLRDV